MKSYERRFIVEYFELLVRIANLEEYIARRRAGEEVGACALDLLELQLDTMRKYQYILESRAVLEGINLKDVEL